MDLEDLDLPGLMIRGFVFCTSHGSEFCNKCQYDGRLVNNEHIMRALKKAFPGEKKDSEKFWVCDLEHLIMIAVLKCML